MSARAIHPLLYLLKATSWSWTPFARTSWTIFLDKIGLVNDTIEHLVISHPHTDHFSGANRIVNNRTVLKATVAPFWHISGMGPATYRKLIGNLDTKSVSTTFLSGYNRWYPDGALIDNNNQLDPDVPFIELLGASTGMVRNLLDANVFNPNHLSIMARISWRTGFRMIIAADAQMENWSAFDEARLLEENCQVFRSAHHGSGNGTQWERINRLDPRELIVSSEPGANHHLPDIMGSAVFAKFDSQPNRMAMLTDETGTIHLTVTPGGGRTYTRFDDSKTAMVDLGDETALDQTNNPTDWLALLNTRVNEL